MSDTHPSEAQPRPGILPQVFYPTAGLIVLLVILSFIAPTQSEAMFGAAKLWVAQEAGWFTVLAVAGFLVFVVGLGISRIGTLKLGLDHSQPDYSYAT